MENYLEDKIKILDLSDKRIKYLKNIKVEELDFSRDYAKYYGKYINADDIVGIARPIFNINSWIDMLNALHKMNNFDMYDKQSFDKLLLNKCNCPEVIEKDGKYYIAGEGKHRLTIAKCLGNKKVFAAVTNYYGG